MHKTTTNGIINRNYQDLYAAKNWNPKTIFKG